MGRILGFALIGGGIIVGIIIIVLMSVYRGENSLSAGAATLGAAIGIIVLVLPQLGVGTFLLWKGRQETAVAAKANQQRKLLDMVKSRGQIDISDLVTAGPLQPPRLWMGRCSERSWLEVELVDPSGNPLALGARDALAADGVSAAVISMPCVEWFDAQPQEYRDTVLPPSVRARVSVEAGIAMPWYRFVGDAGEIVSIEHYGASASDTVLFEKFGFTVEAVTAAANRSIGKARP